VAPLRAPEPTPTEAAHARATQLLERYGVLTREAALGEGSEGGFAGVYPVLKAMEERGAVRRGYFVAGLGAAQFALPGAVDRLRAVRQAQGDERSGDRDDDAAPLLLAATDPAQPYGAALPWPESAGRPARSAGAGVVLVDGEPAVWLERGGRSLVTFPAASAEPAWADALAGIVRSGRRRSLEIGKVDGLPVRESPVADQLRAVGFQEGYKGLVLRSTSNRSGR
jgi:ATP-dependent Lhr-like helicase